MYLEKNMKNLLVVLVVAFSSFGLLAVAGAQTSEQVGHNVLASFAPSVKSQVTGKSGLSKHRGEISISRRSQPKKDRAAAASESDVKKTLVLRDKSPEISSKAFGFEFYSASSYLNFDLDSDGYYSDFTLAFDADFDNGYADVYAVVYYSQDGGPWTEFYETEVFTIFSDDASDEFSVDSVLNFGFPTSEYDFLIDLYEDGITGVVATVGPEEDIDLFALPLEDEEHELSSNLSQISFVASDLFGDFDADGFYTDLTLEYDIATQYVGDTVYAEVVIINPAEGWQQTLFSDNFTLGNQTEFVDLIFNEGYPADWYDVQIKLINVFTGEVIADAGQEFSSLRSLPIESVNNDNFFDGPTSDVDVIISGSGSLGWGFLLLGLLGLGWRRAKGEK